MSKKRTDEHNTGTLVPPSGTAVPPSGTAVPLSGTAVPPSGTAVPPSGTAVPPGGEGPATGQVAGGPAKQVAFDDSLVTEFEINGVKFKKEECISSQSGEARVFLVEHKGTKYALKIYNAHRHPNHDVLEKLKALRGNGLTVDVFEHGVMDFGNGAKHDYELMRYYTGRNLSQVSLKGKEDLFRKLAPRMAMAIDFCHKNGILHRDIKPANFMFVDKRERDFVLTDFGIAKILDDQKRATTDAGRTPVYAAPEMYKYYYDKPTYVSTPSDFYAMGMTLLAMWKGEGNLIANEEKLVKDKEEETLPYPDVKEIDGHNLQLLKALTRRNADIRAGFDQVVQWSKGETIYEDPTYDGLKTDFRVVFSRDKNLIAHSRKELAKMMWANKKLAKEYLYSDMVADWMEDNEEPELKKTILTYTEDTYAEDQDAGLFATCLLLDEDMPYTSNITKKVLKDEYEIARDIFDNVRLYANALKDPYSNLWIYLRHIDAPIDVDFYVEAVEDRGISALDEMCYDIDPDLPFMYRADSDSGKDDFEIRDFEHLRSLMEKDADSFMEAGKRRISVFASEEFKQWVKGRDEKLYDAIWDMNYPVDDDPFGWFMVYHVCGNVDYQFKKVQKREDSEWLTIDDLANQLARFIGENPTDWQNLNRLVHNSFTEQLTPGPFYKDFADSRVCQYLRSKGKYDKQIEWIRECLTLKSTDNKRKYGRFNGGVAQMKMIAGLLPSRRCPLYIDNQTITTLDEFKQHEAEIRKAMDRGNAVNAMVQDWLAVQFQENPQVDLKKTPYLQKTKEYLEFMQEHVPNAQSVKNAEETHNKIRNAKAQFTVARAGTRTIHIAAIVLGFLPLLLACIYGGYVFATTDSGIFLTALESTGKWVGIIIGILVALVCAAEAGLLAGGIVGVIVYALIAWVFVLIVPAVPWILIAILALVLWVGAVQLFQKVYLSRKPVDNYGTMDLNEAATYAEIGAAFGSRDKLLPGMHSEYPAIVYKDNASNARKGRGQMALRGFSILLLAVLIFAGSAWFRSYATGKASAKSQAIEMYNGTYTGQFDDRNSTMTLTTDTIDGKYVVTGEMTINYRHPLNHQLKGTIDPEHPEKLKLNVVKADGTVDRYITYTIGKAKDADDTIEGSYANNHKGSSYTYKLTKK